MLGLFLSNYPGTAEAGVLESLVMPGPLVEGHAEHESSCGKCHSLFDKQQQTTLCLDCHKDIDRDLLEKTGFHGRSTIISTTECRSCHTDHIGRKMDISGLNREAFEHSLTDYELDGRHRTVACEACHITGKKFRETSHECSDCHEKDDIHKTTLGTDCDSCHTTKQWNKTRFDHDETEFKLEAAHAEASCESCHPAGHYKDAPKQCNDCHRVDDVHNKSYGTDCAECHNTSKWTDSNFNHKLETDFPLRGKHQSATCSSCHKDGLKADKLDTNCNSCHAQEDIHRNRFGASCDSCHSESGWKISSFKHDNDTDYPLKGKHQDLLCESCHQSAVNKNNETRGCFDCHQADDVHKGEEGTRCSRCHTEDGWSSKIRFDHDLTTFPLIGLHAALSCEACHLSGEFRGAPKACHSCHAADDTHAERLGRDCQTCHTPNDWQLWRFSHDTQTDFELDGKHQDLDCLACHLAPLEQNHALPKNCAACHQEDDVHDGNFASQCDRCHSTEGFRNPDISN